MTQRDADLELADEAVSLQQLVADVLECVSVAGLVDSKHVKRPVVHVLHHTHNIVLL